MVSLILPKSHRDTMEVLFVFLKWVAFFAYLDEETGSKMDLGNLATVICPSILYSRGRDAVRDESFGAIRVVTALLENQDEFFAVPEEFLGILHDQDYFANAMDLPSKDFMKKCDTYMRLKSGGRLPGTPLSGISSSAPRFPPNSPNPERPAMGGPAPSDRNIRPPHPGMPPSNASYPPLGSPSLSQGQPSRTPQTDEWPTTPRPINPNSSSSSRPSSFAAPPRPSGEHSHSFSPHGNPSAVRQRT